MAVALVLSLAALTPGFCAEMININTANESQLTTLNGVGPVLAKRIIDYREKHPFQSNEEIMEVKGIGEATFAKIKDYIVIE